MQVLAFGLGRQGYCGKTSSHDLTCKFGLAILVILAEGADVKSNKFGLGSRIGFGALVLLGGLVIAMGTAIGIAFFGVYDVSASQGHAQPVAWLLHYVMERSVANYAQPLPHPDLDDPALIVRGATHFATGCAPCHGAPGQLVSPIAAHMTPVPPPLYSAGHQFSPDQLFWIIRNGIKMTAMPGWPAGNRQDEVWAMVAFVKHLHEFNTQGYAATSGESGGETLLDGAFSAASADPAAFNPAACERCHDPAARGKQGEFPQLNGLSARYIADALRSYRDGSRPSGFMQPIAAAMNDREIEAAASYFAGQSRLFLGDTELAPAKLQRGAQLSAGTAPDVKVPACVSCHLPRSSDLNATIPPLTGQPADYLSAQLHLLAGGERPTPSPQAKMAQSSHKLSDDDIAAVSTYFAETLPGN